MNINQSISKGRGGKRPGAGRKKGSETKRTQLIAQAAAAEGISPLEYMLKVMRAPLDLSLEPRELAAQEALKFEAAKAAAPYVHPRLAAIEHTGKNGAELGVHVYLPKNGR